MVQPLPLLPISQEQLQQLIAAMLIYWRFRQKKTPNTEERRRTLFILEFLIPKLYRGVGVHEEATPLWLTTDDVSVLKSGMATLIAELNRKPASRKITEQIQQLKKLKTLIEQTFPTTQD